MKSFAPQQQQGNITANNSHAKHRRCFAVLLAAMAFCGCSFDPEKTVTIEITGTLSDAARQEISERLKTMTDTGNHLMQSSYSGNMTTIKLQPVSKPQAFAKKIDFGEVTAVEGRTIKVTVKTTVDAKTGK